MQTTRDLTLDLRPAMLDDLGLTAALRWYADRFAKKTDIEMHLALQEISDLPPAVATSSFRVAQEALTNVVRHASAKNVWLKACRTSRGFELVVCDDGVGFDVDAAPPPRREGCVARPAGNGRARGAGRRHDRHSEHGGNGNQDPPPFPDAERRMTPICVLRADDHTLVRTGIRGLLEGLPGVEVAGETGDGTRRCGSPKRCTRTWCCSTSGCRD